MARYSMAPRTRVLADCDAGAIGSPCAICGITSSSRNAASPPIWSAASATTGVHSP